ncbi:M14 family metallocarboxypeptidase [Aquibacillus koreensis]|uniref:M14 family metallocarboxypeptidase n=1 Tax=Aquibacillus koreensis TaxID=279446 RepID=A0A9X3WII7_9BACI|nr:M14 family metallocarboxypeptidase [Aquibacillus koreensis]MCT2535951.1 M14 family metallocarboxypeptidase [Aquibacillus koreensis]MDC3420407.1 M14 family metallocarboxypeptidase [Aquibacillus koreensis]
MAIVNPKQEYTYEQMEKDIDMLQQTYPDIITKEVIGYSVDGRNIYAIKLGTGKAEIFLNGAHHAREWLTTCLLMHMLETYSKAYTNKAKIGAYDAHHILSNTAVWFVPMVNPDGVMLVQQGHKSASNPEKVLLLNDGSADFSSWKSNIRGVDLNRQYPADWDEIADDTGKPGPMMYKGPYPLSEPESKAMVDFTLKHDFKTAVAYHSSGEELFWKYKISGELLNTSRRLAEMICDKTGYELVFPGQNPSGGGYTDWFLTHIKQPGFTPEISPLVGPRPVPLENYDKIWNDNKEVGLMLAHEVNLNKEKR